MTGLATQRRLGFLAAAMVMIIAGVHFQQYVDFMSQVPAGGVLFLLNAAGGAGIASALLGLMLRRSPAAVTPAGS
jgi:hypothetical protein